MKVVKKKQSTQFFFEPIILKAGLATNKNLGPEVIVLASLNDKSNTSMIKVNLFP